MRIHWSDRDRLWEIDRERDLRDQRDGRHSRYDRDRPGTPRDLYPKDSRYDPYIKDRGPDYPPPAKRREYAPLGSSDREKYRYFRDEHDSAPISNNSKPTDLRSGLSSEHSANSKSHSSKTSDHSPNQSVSSDRSSSSLRKEATSRAQSGSDDLFPHLLGENGEPAKKRESENKRSTKVVSKPQSTAFSKQVEKARPKVSNTHLSVTTSPASSIQRTSSLPGSLESTTSSFNSSYNSTSSTSAENSRSKSASSSSSKTNLHEVLKNSIAKPAPLNIDKSASSKLTIDTSNSNTFSKPSLQSDIFSKSKVSNNEKSEQTAISPSHIPKLELVDEKKERPLSQISSSGFADSSKHSADKTSNTKEKEKLTSSTDLNKSNNQTRNLQETSSKVPIVSSELVKAKLKNTILTSESKASVKTKLASKTLIESTTKMNAAKIEQKSKPSTKLLLKSSTPVDQASVSKSAPTFNKESNELSKSDLKTQSKTELKTIPKSASKPELKSGVVTNSRLTTNLLFNSKLESKVGTITKSKYVSNVAAIAKSKPESEVQTTPKSKHVSSVKSSVKPTPEFFIGHPAKSKSDTQINLRVEHLLKSNLESKAEPTVTENLKSKEQSNTKSKLEVNSDSKSQPTIKSNDMSKADLLPKSKPLAKPENTINSNLESKLGSKSKTDPEIKHNFNDNVKSDSKIRETIKNSGSNLESMYDNNSHPALQFKSGLNPVIQSESKSVSKPDPESELESNSNPISISKSKAESELKSDCKPILQPVSKSDSNRASQPVSKAESKSVPMKNKPACDSTNDSKSGLPDMPANIDQRDLTNKSIPDAIVTNSSQNTVAVGKQVTVTSNSITVDHSVSKDTKDTTKKSLGTTINGVKPESALVVVETLEQDKKLQTDPVVTKGELVNIDKENHDTQSKVSNELLSEEDCKLLSKTATIPPLEKRPLKMPREEEDLPLIFPLNKLEQGIHDIKQLSQSELRADMKYISSKPIKSLEEYPFYLQNQKINDFKICKVLFDQISEHKKHMHEDSLDYKKRFKTLKASWLRYCKAVESSNNFMSFKQENASPFVDSNATGSSRRSRNNGDSVRSEAEYMEILANLERESAKDPSVRAKLTSAVVPTLIFDPIERDEIRYVDTNNFVADKSIPYKRLMSDNIDNFTPEEHEAFCEAYVMSPKQFGKISKVMGGRRSFNDCVLHYYQTKKQVDYKSLLLNRNRRTTRKGRKKAQKEKEKAIARNPAELALANEQAKKEPTPDASVKDEGNGNMTTVSVKSLDELDRKRPASDADVLTEGTRKRTKKPRGIAAKFLKEKKKIEESEIPDANVPSTEVSDTSGASQQKSYWSVSENSLFQQLLLSYGSNWSKIAKHFKTKSYVMVKNHCSKNQDWVKLAAETDEKIAKDIPVPAPPDIIDLDVRKRKNQNDSSHSRSNSAVSTPVQRSVTPSNLSEDLRLNNSSIQQPSSAETALRNALDKRYTNRTSSPSAFQQSHTHQPQPQSQPQPFQHQHSLSQPFQQQAFSFVQPRPVHASIQSLLQNSEETNHSRPLSIASLSGNGRTLPVPPALSRSSSPQNQIKTLPKLTEHQSSTPLAQSYSADNKSSFSYSGISATASGISFSPSGKPLESPARSGYYMPPLSATTNGGYYMPQQKEKEQVAQKQESQGTYYSQTFNPISGEIQSGSCHQRTVSSSSGGMALSNITDIPSRSYNGSTTVPTSTSSYSSSVSTHFAPNSRPNSLSNLLNPVSNNDSDPTPAPLKPIQPVVTCDFQSDRTGWYDAARESITPTALPASSSFTQNSKGQVLLPSLTGITPKVASRSFSTMFSDRNRGTASPSANSSVNTLGSSYNSDPSSNRSAYLPLPSLSGHPSFGASSGHTFNNTSSTGPSIYSSSNTSQPSTFKLYNHLRAPDQAVDLISQPSSFFSNTRSVLPLPTPGQPTAPGNPPYGGYEYMSKESNERSLPYSSLNSHQKR